MFRGSEDAKDAFGGTKMGGVGFSLVLRIPAF
jgi:hypothetical protein